ncbi:Transposase IS4 [Popillia japonica]|uniref:Transposase IS4 n=1 Tax=Popillia japonica TaxID=7064 RepID=A0AAW1L6X7_POPJA
MITEKELVDALYESDEDLGRNVNDGEDEEEPNDETSSSEMDYQETGDEESDEQEGSDDSDDEPPGHSQTFIGKDGTEWNATPIAKGKTRAHNIITTALNKVKLPPEVHVDTPCDAFNLFLDDTVIGRGRVSFRQYLPSKPDKYGMKIWWICDSRTSYPLRGIPYLGKEGLNRAENLAQRVVEDLCEPFLRTKRNITFDKKT